MAIDSAKAHQILEKLRELCETYPEVNERLSHHTPTFFVRDKKVLCHLWEGSHKKSDANELPMIAIWCAAPAGVQTEVTEREPDRFFVPPYVGHRGWIGVRLDQDIDWSEIDAILRDAYRLVAPKKLVNQLDTP